MNWIDHHVDITITVEKPASKNWIARIACQALLSTECRIRSSLSCCARFWWLVDPTRSRSASRATWHCCLRWTWNVFRWISCKKIFLIYLSQSAFLTTCLVFGTSWRSSHSCSYSWPMFQVFLGHSARSTCTISFPCWSASAGWQKQKYSNSEETPYNFCNWRQWRASFHLWYWAWSYGSRQ